MKRLLFTAALISFSILLMPGCLPATEASPTVSPGLPAVSEPTITLPAPTTAPVPVLSIDNLVLEPSGGQILVYGTAVNEGTVPVENVRIHVSVEDETGKKRTTSTGLLVEHLAPGETSPFQASFENTSTPVHAYASISNMEEGHFKRVRLDYGDAVERADTDGTTWIVVPISNPSASPVCLYSLGAAAYSEETGIQQYNLDVIGPHTISASSDQEYFFHFNQVKPGSLFQFFLDSQHCETEPEAPGIIAEAEILFDDQDNPFMLGTLTNTGTSPLLAETVLTLSEGNMVLTMMEISPPVPVNPGEPTAFTLGAFPALHPEALTDAFRSGRLAITIQADPARTRETLQAPVLLEASVSGLENTGSRLIFTGVISNNQEFAVRAAVVLRITETNGDLITAGWTTSSENLAAGESIPYQLILPVPSGIDLRFSEQDLRAYGVLPVESLP